MGYDELGYDELGYDEFEATLLEAGWDFQEIEALWQKHLSQDSYEPDWEESELDRLGESD